jgi:SAM-dependent methyltransferase
MQITNLNFVALSQALNDPSAVEFTRGLISKNYAEYFTGHEQAASQIVDHAFDLLIQSQAEKADSDKLDTAVAAILRDGVKKEDRSFWYNRLYNYYKSTIKPKAEFEKYQPYIQGTKVLDFGSGKGYLAQLLTWSGYEVIGTDIEDYRAANLLEIPFIKMTSPKTIPLPSRSIDTALVITVLHHIDKKLLSSILKELARISKRVIIVEDITLEGVNQKTVPSELLGQHQYQLFKSLSTTSQSNANILTDFFGNVVSQGITNMNLPFQFRTIPEWKLVLEDNNFHVKETNLLGFSNKYIHGFFKALFVCESFPSDL